MLEKIVGKIWKTLTPTLRSKAVRLTQNRFTVSVAAIVTNHRGEVLLLDHVLRPASGWGIPGGFLNRGEQPETAVRRELFEETGIELTDLKLIGTRTADRHVEILFRAVSNDLASVQSREIKEVRWCRPDAMPEDMSRFQKSVIEKLLKDIL